MLPARPTLDEWRALRRDTAAQRGAVEAVAARHGLALSELAPFPRGTHLAWGTERSVVKIFVPLWPDDARVETRLLDHLTGRGLPTPQLAAQGEIGGWPYVVMSRVRGERIGDVWTTLAATERARLAREVGALMARLAELPTTGLDDLRTTQEALLAERRPRLLADQRERGAGEALLADVDAFARALPPLADAPSVLLHADLTDDHVLVTDGAITGLIDFADAFVGPWTYELAAPACFLTRGDDAARDALLAGRGVEPGAEVARAVRAWAVLHRYAHVAIMMERAGHATLATWLHDVWPEP